VTSPYLVFKQLQFWIMFSPTHPKKGGGGEVRGRCYLGVNLFIYTNFELWSNSDNNVTVISVSSLLTITLDKCQLQNMNICQWSSYETGRHRRKWKSRWDSWSCIPANWALQTCMRDIYIYIDISWHMKKYLCYLKSNHHLLETESSPL
jgi:hypothetical protein